MYSFSIQPIAIGPMESLEKKFKSNLNVGYLGCGRDMICARGVMVIHDVSIVVIGDVCAVPVSLLNLLRCMSYSRVRSSLYG